MKPTITALIVRVFQIVFGVIVLGLSIKAIKWQRYGSVPATTSYSAVAGAFGILTALIGIATIFVEVIPDLITAAVDALASVLLLAGGIAIAVGLKTIHCGDLNNPSCFDLPNPDFSLLDGGCKGKGNNEYCGINDTSNSNSAFASRLKLMEADAAFLFLAFLVSVGAAVLYYLASRRSGGGARHSTA